MLVRVEPMCRKRNSRGGVPIPSPDFAGAETGYKNIGLGAMPVLLAVYGRSELFRQLYYS